MNTYSPQCAIPIGRCRRSRDRRVAVLQQRIAGGARDIVVVARHGELADLRIALHGVPFRVTRAHSVMQKRLVRMPG